MLQVISDRAATARIDECLHASFSCRIQHVARAFHIDFPDQIPVLSDISAGERRDDTGSMDDHGRLGLMNRSPGFFGICDVCSGVIDCQLACRIAIRRLEVDGGDGAFRMLFEKRINDGRANEARSTSDQSAGN